MYLKILEKSYFPKSLSFFLVLIIIFNKVNILKISIKKFNCGKCNGKIDRLLENNKRSLNSNCISEMYNLNWDIEICKYRDLYIAFKKRTKRASENVYYLKNRNEMVTVPCIKTFSIEGIYITCETS